MLGRVHDESLGPEVALLDAVLDHLRAARALGEPGTVRVVGVDHGDAAHRSDPLEQDAFRVAVGLEGAVVVEVLVGEVRVDAHVDADAVESPLLQALAAHLDDRLGEARLHHPAQHLLNLRGAGGGDVLAHRDEAGAVLDADRGDEADRAAGGGVDDAAQQHRRRRLAVGAGDTGHLDLLRREAPPGGGEVSERLLRVVHPRVRHAHIHLLGVADHGDRAAGDSLHGEGAAVDHLALSGDEHAPRLHLIGTLDGRRADLRIPVDGDEHPLRQGVQQAGERRRHGIESTYRRRDSERPGSAILDRLPFAATGYGAAW